jgi:hypothetical protein
MIEGFQPQAVVIVNLVNPKEKFFAVLLALSAAGLTIRGVNLDSFEDWVRELAHDEEPGIGMVTMFVPMFRVERIFLDEPAGAIRSYQQRFEEIAGLTVRDYLEREAEAGG